MVDVLSYLGLPILLCIVIILMNTDYFVEIYNLWFLPYRLGPKENLIYRKKTRNIQLWLNISRSDQNHFS